MSTPATAVLWNVKSQRAIKQRVDRILKRRGEKLVRGVGREREAVGGWYLVHIESGKITAVMLNFEFVARFLGALEPWEKLEDSNNASG